MARTFRDEASPSLVKEGMPRVAVKIAIINPNNEILLVQHHEHGLILPGGGVSGLDLEEATVQLHGTEIKPPTWEEVFYFALVRELKEELSWPRNLNGVLPDIDEGSYIGGVNWVRQHLDGTDLHCVDLCFLAPVSNDNAQIFNELVASNEITGFRWVVLNEVENYDLPDNARETIELVLKNLPLN